MANWGFAYQGVDFSFNNIKEQAFDIMPYGTDLTYGSCGWFDNDSPTPDEIYKRTNMRVQDRGWHFGENGISIWQNNIVDFNAMSIQQMNLCNFNDVESNYQLVAQQLALLSQALTMVRVSILQYIEDGNSKDRICESKGFWRDARDSNREFGYKVTELLNEVLQLKENALKYESGEEPTPPPPESYETDGGEGDGGDGGVINGCMNKNATNYDPSATLDDGTCGQKSDAEKNLIKIGKVLLALIGFYFAYRVVKKYWL